MVCMKRDNRNTKHTLIQSCADNRDVKTFLQSVEGSFGINSDINNFVLEFVEKSHSFW